MTSQTPSSSTQDTNHILPNLLNGVIGFHIKELNIRGRFIRLSSELGEILSMHDYPMPVSRLLGESLLLSGLLGTTLKFKGRLTLQLQGDGPVRFVVADYKTPDGLRGCVTMEEASSQNTLLQEFEGEGTKMLGNGQLVFTIDQGEYMQNYQGIVPLTGESVAHAAEEYFAQSEQLPTSIKLAALEYKAQDQNPTWIGGGILIQYLPQNAQEIHRDLDDGTGNSETNALPDDWITAKLLTETVQADELSDPFLHPHEVLYRLFNEYEVEVYDAQPLQRFCQCSYEKCKDMLSQFPKEDLHDMADEKGKISIKCQFCSTEYLFEPSEFQN